MNITLGPDAKKLVEDRMKRGGYATAEDVIVAGLSLLDQTDGIGDFAPGEWDALLEEAERSGEPLDAEEVFAELRGLGSKVASDRK